MTILSSIRSRIGIIVGIIFVALLAFVLTDMLNGQRGILGGTNTDIGEINGHTISYSEFKNKMDAMDPEGKADEQTREQFEAATWQEMNDQYIYQPQWEKAGVVVTSEELDQQMMGDHPSMFMNQFFQDRQTGQINPEFANPDGSLSGAAIRKLVKNFQPEQETQWVRLQGEMAKTITRDKYNTLLGKGLYVTSAQAKREFAEENTRYDFKYFSVKYATIADSTLKVSDSEIEEYYKGHLSKFRQRESTRSMEYVSFDIFPSADDIAAQRKDMDSLATRFATMKTPAEDSMFAVGESETGAFQKTWMRAGQFPVGTDSSFMNAEKGKVFGPFNSGNDLVVYKVTDHKTSGDSAKVRHILVAYKGAAQAGPDITRTKEQAKLRADSILRVVKAGKTKMEDIVAKLTDDPGSKGDNKGDYGWFTEESGFVQPFKDAGFNNPKGATVIVTTDFGYHVIQVLDKTAPSLKTQVITITKKTEPSEKTNQDLYNQASTFALTNNKGDLFTKAVQAKSMNLLKSNDIQENAKTIQGIDNARTIIRWMYDEKTEVGSISEPFQAANRYIVCHLTNILEKGYKPVSDASVREICMLEVRKEKKAKQFIDQLNKQKGANIDLWAANAKETVQMAQGVTFLNPAIQAAGYEGEVLGVVSRMDAGKLSAPIKGTMGVYVVALEKVTPAGELKDVKAQRIRSASAMAGRATDAAMTVLKEEANITDNRAKFF